MANAGGRCQSTHCCRSIRRDLKVCFRETTDLRASIRSNRLRSRRTKAQTATAGVNQNQRRHRFECESQAHGTPPAAPDEQADGHLRIKRMRADTFAFSRFTATVVFRRRGKRYPAESPDTAAFSPVAANSRKVPWNLHHAPCLTDGAPSGPTRWPG